MVRRLLARVTLLRLLVVTSGLVLGVGGVVLGSLVTGAIRDQALEDADDGLEQYVDGVLVNELVTGDQLMVTRQLPASTRRELENRDDILSVKVWRPDGVLAWTSVEPDRIGKRYPVGHHLAEALGGEGEAELEDLEGEAEHAGELRDGIERALEVYAPLRSPKGEVIGAYEVYADASDLESTIASRARQIWLVIVAVFLGLFAALGLLVRRASDTLRIQTRLLRERSEALAKSFEALERNTLEALRWGGLFHDIGKIAIPDTILLKPARLTEEEFERMKEHSAEGARIVAKLGHLKPTVPLIRHHHERWDGSGYPDGLAGLDIPLLATIVGLADAWDAMTTERPYADALPDEVALEEIRRGRGTQFAPAVVDAFLRAYERGLVEGHTLRELVPA